MIQGRRGEVFLLFSPAPGILTMQNQHIKNRAKKLESAYATADADRKNLYRAALHWRATSTQQYEETKLLTGVVYLGFALLSSCIFYIIILKEVSKG